MNDLTKEINKSHTDSVYKMIEDGVLETMDNEEIKNTFRSLMSLRNMDIIDLLAKKSHYFPIEMLLFLLGKGLGESQYPRLISGSDTLLEVLSEIKVKALHQDTVVTFFVEAAISDQSEKRIRELIDLGFDITAVNSSGKNACDMLRTGIESYNYGKGKQGKTEKQRDLQGLKTLERLYSAYIAG